MYQMVWSQRVPDMPARNDFVRLRPEHAREAVDLAALTRPGPFGPRTIELGEYWGHFVDGRLVAMAGERLHCPPFREISGVATHPAYQGNGFARSLMTLLTRRAWDRGEIPFLHVMCHNTHAWQLYERLGYERRCELPVLALSRRLSSTGTTPIGPGS